MQNNDLNVNFTFKDLKETCSEIKVYLSWNSYSDVDLKI